MKNQSINNRHFDKSLYNQLIRINLTDILGVRHREKHCENSNI